MLAAMEVAMEVGVAALLLGVAWWRPSALFGLFYAVCALTWIALCSKTRAKAMAFTSCRVKTLAPRKAYTFLRRKALIEAKLWRAVTFGAWIDLALQSFAQLLLKLSRKGPMSERFLQVLQALGFSELSSGFDFMKVYGALFLLMPFLYGNYFVAKQRQNDSNVLPPLSIASCRAAYLICTRCMILSVVVTSVAWPSIFGLVYLLVAATYFVSAFDYDWISPLLRKSWNRNIGINVVTVSSLSQFALLYFVQIQCNGREVQPMHEHASCFLSLFPRSWTRFLGLFSTSESFDALSSSNLDVVLFQIAEIIAVTLNLCFSLFMVSPELCFADEDGNILKDYRSMTFFRNSNRKTAAESPLEIPLLQDDFEVMEEMNSREFWEEEIVGRNVKFSERFAVTWMYFVNICACCLILVSPSLLSNLLLLLALVNIFLIQHQILSVRWMSVYGQGFCGLILLTSYFGKIIACSDTGVLAFMGLSCIKDVLNQALVGSFELALILLFSTSLFVAKNTVATARDYQRETELPLDAAEAAPSASASLQSLRSKLVAETLFTGRCVLAGLVLSAYVVNLLWISTHRVNAMSFLFSLQLWGYLISLKGAKWFTACQSFAMFYLGVIAMCDNAVVLFVLKGRAKTVMDKLGVISSDPLRDIFPLVSLILLNLLMQSANSWYKQINARARVQTLKAWRAMLGCARFIASLIPYLLLGLLFYAIVYKDRACSLPRFDFLGCGYLIFSALIIYFSQQEQASGKGMRLWALLRGLAFLDYTLQILSFSENFGFASFPTKVREVMLLDVGCISPDSNWQCFAMSMARPFCTLILLKVQTFCQHHSGKHPSGSSAPPIVEFLQRILTRHGTKLLALSTMALSSLLGGVFGLVLVIAMFWCGICPRTKLKYAYAHFVQLASMLLVVLQYLFHVKIVEMNVVTYRHYLAWIGIWEERESIHIAFAVLALSIIACHLQLISKRWESRLLKNGHCALFTFGSDIPPVRQYLGDQDCFTPTFGLDEIKLSERTPSILPKYSSSSSSFKLHRSYSFPDEVARNLMYEQDENGLLLEEDAMSNHASESDYFGAREDNKERQVSLQSLQWQCVVSYVKYQAEYFDRKGIKVLLSFVLMLSSGICCNLFSLFYLIQILILLLASEEWLVRKHCLRVFSVFNSTLLVAGVTFGAVTDSPWVAGVSCGSKDTLNRWLGLCTDGEMVWSIFLTAWMSIEYEKATIAPKSDYSKNAMKANLLIQMNELFFLPSSDQEKTWIEALFRFMLRHSLDFALTLITLISLINIDVLHLGYFGLSLLYMRCRGQIWQGRYKSLWWIIILYNILVIFAIVSYQAPWKMIFGGKAVEGEATCSVQHVLGVYFIQNFWEQAFQVHSRDGGLIYDIIIFIIVYFQKLVFHTKAFHCLVVAYQREKDNQYHEIEERDQLWREQQVAKALRAREHTAARKLRVEWLKGGLLKSKQGSVDANLCNDQYFNSIGKKFGSKHSSTAIESAPPKVIERNSTEQLNPFTMEDPEFSLFEGPALKRIRSMKEFGKYYLMKFRLMLIYKIREMYARRRDTDSYLVYSLLIFTFIYEFSIAASLFPLFLFGFALISPGIKSKTFWHFLFYYVEICLSVRYCFWIPFEHNCPGFEVDSFSEIQQSSEYWLLLLGVQPKPFPRSIPMMLLYLSIVWHHESVLQMSKVYGNIGESIQESTQSGDLTLKGRLRDIFWPVYNFLADICSKSEHGPFILQLSLKHPEAGDPWNAIPLDEAQEYIHKLYSKRSDENIIPKLPEDLCKRLEGAKVSFIVKSIEAVSTRRTDSNSVDLHDVMILEISRIHLSARKKLVKPASDIALMLKAISNELQNENFCILEADAVVRQKSDLYVLTLCADILCFIFALVFYQACLESRTQSLLKSFSMKSVFPADYIFALVLLFTLIVCDRAIYVLNSNVSKVIYHFATVGFFLVYLMAQYWKEDIRLSDNSGLKQVGLASFFALKSVSFLLSSRQIRTGFPTNTLGHWVMSEKTIFRLVCFTIYKFIPFLRELRTMLDWTCTKTTLEFFDWLRVEEIRYSLFQTAMRNRLRLKGIGLKQHWYTKFFTGLLGFTLISVIIWGPLLIYSSNNPDIVVPDLTDVKVNLTLTKGMRSYPLFSGGQERTVHSWKHKSEYFPISFTNQQVQLVALSPHADDFWTVSPPRKLELANTLEEEDGGNMHVTMNFLFKKTYPVTAQDCFLSVSHPLSNVTAHGLKDVLDGTRHYVPLQFETTEGGTKSVHNSFFNLFAQVGGDVQACEVNNMFHAKLKASDGNDFEPVSVNCSLGIDSLSESDCNQGPCEWWSMLCEQDIKNSTQNHRPPRRERQHLGPQIVLVFEKTVGEGVLSIFFASRGGLIGLYVSFVLVVGRLMHSSFSGLRPLIPYNELPSTVKLQSIINDIDAARAEAELGVEQELYWGLIRIYRSPAVLFELTKKQA